MKEQKPSIAPDPTWSYPISSLPPTTPAQNDLLSKLRAEIKKAHITQWNKNTYKLLDICEAFILAHHNATLDELIGEVGEMMFQIRENDTGETYKAHKALSDVKGLLTNKKI